MKQIIFTQPLAPIVNNMQQINLSQLNLPQTKSINNNQQLVIGLSQIGYIQNNNTNTSIYQLQYVPVMQQTPVLCPPSVPVTLSSFRHANNNIQHAHRNMNIPASIANLINTIANTSQPHQNRNSFNRKCNAFLDPESSPVQNRENISKTIKPIKPVDIQTKPVNIKHEPLQSIQKHMRSVSHKNSTNIHSTTNSNRLIHNDTCNQYYPCKHCNKKFLRKSNLICHQKIHGPNPYLCPFCDKPFARNCNLQQHIRVHTGEKPFRCKLCNKSFKQQHSLKYHTRLHLGEYPYQCKYCAKRFAAKCNCIVHIRTHTGEKPYECSICSKKYASKSGLNSHCQRNHM